MTAEDVKFSFERYRGAAAKLLKDRVAAVEVVDPQKVRFHLKKPWLDFMTFFATPATGAAWIVPKKYVEKVGDEGFKKAPVGAGPYKFVSFKPGVELVLEAHEGYWRKPPAIKTLVFRVIPDESTRLAALKRGEVDIAYSITGALAEELKQTKGLTLAPTYFTFTTWLLFTDQWDAKSPWHDQRVRLAANLAIDRQAINQAAYLGLAKPALSFVPSGMEYFWAPPPYPYDPAKAKQLLAEAGYPNGFDGGDLSGEMIYGSAIGEPVTNYLQAVGIRTRLRLMERAAYYKEYSDKKLRGSAPHRQRRPRQRRHPRRLLRRHRRHLRVQHVPRDRRPLLRAGERAEPARAHADPPEDPADHPRPRDVRARSWSRRS